MSAAGPEGRASGRIRDEDIAAVRQAVRIEEIVGEHVTLKRAGGGNWTGLCPFHDEKGPSFNVTPAKGYFYCLAGETRVLTWDGPVEIRSLAGKTAKVLTSANLWVDAPFFSFGVQPLMKITITREGKSKDIFATAEHRWFITAGEQREEKSERVTSELRPGDRLVSQNEAYERRGWVVQSVEATDRVEEVFCAVVDSTHDFTLEDNILTGNCFGCSAGGDAISFVQKIEHLTFVEAVEKLAERYKVDLRYADGARPAPGLSAGMRSRLTAANEAAAKFFRGELLTPAGAAGRAFLTERGFDQAAADTFEIGYSPAGWDRLITHLKALGYTDQEMITAGLVIERDGGGIYDRFRDRLMWPIRNLSGDVIGFGARKLSPEDQGPKFLNTPETPLYKKSEVLYGIHQARKAIAQGRQAVVVEGYADVMACHLAGITTAVAACGTAFGEGHTRIIRRLIHDDDMYASRVIFTFDGDAAGQKAALRAFKENQKFTATTYVAVAPDNMDPCDLRQHRGDQSVRDLIASAVPLAEFVIKTTLAAHDLTTVEGRTGALRSAAPVVASLRDLPMRAQYVTQVAGWLGMDERHVRSAVTRAASAGTGAPDAPGEPHGEDENAQTPGDGLTRPNPKDLALLAEREALKVLLQAPHLATGWDEQVQASCFTHPAYVAVFQAYTGAPDGPGRGDQVRQDQQGTPLGSLLMELSVEPLATTAPDDDYARGVLARLLERDCERRIAATKSRMAHGDSDPALLEQLMALQKHKQDLRAWARG